MIDLDSCTCSFGCGEPIFAGPINISYLSTVIVVCICLESCRIFFILLRHTSTEFREFFVVWVRVSLFYLLWNPHIFTKKTSNLKSSVIQNVEAIICWCILVWIEFSNYTSLTSSPFGLIFAL